MLLNRAPRVMRTAAFAAASALREQRYAQRCRVATASAAVGTLRVE